jgi:hypothetical protein
MRFGPDSTALGVDTQSIDSDGSDFFFRTA